MEVRKTTLRQWWEAGDGEQSAVKRAAFKCWAVAKAFVSVATGVGAAYHLYDWWRCRDEGNKPLASFHPQLGDAATGSSGEHHARALLLSKPGNDCLAYYLDRGETIDLLKMFEALKEPINYTFALKQIGGTKANSLVRNALLKRFADDKSCPDREAAIAAIRHELAKEPNEQDQQRLMLFDAMLENARTGYDPGRFSY